MIYTELEHTLAQYAYQEKAEESLQDHFVKLADNILTLINYGIVTDGNSRSLTKRYIYLLKTDLSGRIGLPSRFTDIISILKHSDIIL